ncbi:MAG: hypothetical protein LW860_14845 [Xanthomonadaceae bacterium]|nr:hypothetical protein [Xanthomonadaceae bacterium]
MPIPRKPRDGPVAPIALSRQPRVSPSESTIGPLRPGGALRQRAALSILAAIANREGRPGVARKRPALAPDDVSPPRAARGDDDLMSAPQDHALSAGATARPSPTVDEAIVPHPEAPLAPANRVPWPPRRVTNRFRVF